MGNYLELPTNALIDWWASKVREANNAMDSIYSLLHNKTIPMVIIEDQSSLNKIIDQTETVLASLKDIRSVNGELRFRGIPLKWYSSPITSREKVLVNWQQFLSSVFLGDAEIIGFVQRLMGYIFSGDKGLGIFPVIHGNGANGKTTFIDAIAEAMGPDVRLCGGYVFDPNKAGSRPRPEMLSLNGVKMAVFMLEGPGGMSNKEMGARLKAFVSDEVITARGVYETEVTTFRNSITPVLVGQEIPKGLFRDKGLASRGVSIPFTARFSPTRRIPGLEIAPSEVRAWVEEGIAEWRSYGLTIPERFRIAAFGKRAA